MSDNRAFNPTSLSSKDQPTKPHRGVVIRVPIPGPNAQRIIKADEALLATSTKTSPVVAESAQGVWVTDVDGNRLLDFAAGISVLNVGHCHPDVVKAVREQAGKLSHFAGTDFYYENQTQLAKRLAAITPSATSRASMTSFLIMPRS